MQKLMIVRNWFVVAGVAGVAMSLAGCNRNEAPPSVALSDGLVKEFEKRKSEQETKLLPPERASQAMKALKAPENPAPAWQPPPSPIVRSAFDPVQRFQLPIQSPPKPLTPSGFVNAPPQPAPVTGATSDVPEVLPHILQSVEPSMQVIWNDRDLYELRLELAGKEYQRQKEEQARINREMGRPTYGGIAPAFFVQRQYVPKGDGTFEIYQPEVDRIDRLERAGQATARDLARRGKISFQLGKHREAVQDFTAALKAGGRTVPTEWLMLRGLACLAIGKGEEALADLKAAASGRDVAALNSLGLVLYKLGRMDEAMKAFDAALDVDQMVVPVQPVRLNRAVILSDLGKYDEALKNIDLAERKNVPEYRLPAAFLRATIALRQEDFNKAGRLFQYVDELAMHDMLAQNHYAADLWADLAFRALPSGEVFHAGGAANRAIAHLRLGQVGKAIEVLSKALEKSPNSVALRINRAAAYLDEGDLQRAEADLAVALKFEPNNPIVLANRSALRLMQGEVTKAEVDRRKSVELRKDMGPAIEKLLKAVRSRAAGAKESQRPAAVKEVPVARTPKEAVALFRDAWNTAVRDKDIEPMLHRLGAPVGPWFLEMQEAAGRFDAAAKKFTAVRNRVAGGFRIEAPNPGNLADGLAEGAGMKLTRLRPFTIERMTVVEELKGDKRGERMVLNVETVLSDGAGKRVTLSEQLVAVLQRGEWKILTPVMTRLTAKDVEYLDKYYAKRVEMLDNLRQCVDDATAALARGESKSLVELNLIKEISRWQEVMLPPPNTEAGRFTRAALDMQPMILASQVKGMYMMQRDARVLNGMMGSDFYHQDVPPPGGNGPRQ